MNKKKPLIYLIHVKRNSQTFFSLYFLHTELNYKCDIIYVFDAKKKNEIIFLIIKIFQIENKFNQI